MSDIIRTAFSSIFGSRHLGGPAVPASAPVAAPAVVGRAPVEYSLIGKDNVKLLQQRLTDVGYLDPPADGVWGGTSMWALGAATGFTNASAGQPLPAAVNQKLAELRPIYYAVVANAPVAAKVLRAFQANKFWYPTASGTRILGYLEGCERGGTPNQERRNAFDDMRFVATVSGGIFSVMFTGDATTRPSVYWTQNPMNEGGAAHIDPGPQKAWRMGYYHGTALVEAADLHVTRDPDCLYKRDPRHPDVGQFGIHHHQGYNLPKDNLANSSAGCQVCRLADEHERSMGLLKADPRYLANNGYLFMSTVFTPEMWHA